MKGAVQTIEQKQMGFLQIFNIFWVPKGTLEKPVKSNKNTEELFITRIA